MTDQIVNPEGLDQKKLSVVRNEDGTFAHGNISNPGGKPPNKGFARWEVRMEQLAAKYDTMDKLMVFFTLNQYGALIPTPALLEMNVIDAGIIRQLVATVVGGAKDTRQDREAFWDRFQGSPTATIHLKKSSMLDEVPTQFDDTPEGRAAASRAFEELLRKPK